MSSSGLGDYDGIARDVVDSILAGAYSREGIEQWWKRPRTVLDGKTPEEVWLNDPEQVIALARGVSR